MYFEDIKIGTEYPITPTVIDKDKMLAFANEYDPQPFHTSETLAKSSPYGTVIAPGIMAFMCIWSKFVKMDVWDGGFLAGQDTNLYWYAPVYPGDTLNATVKVTNKGRVNRLGGLLELTTDVINQNDKCVMRNITNGVIRSREREQHPEKVG